MRHLIFKIKVWLGLAEYKSFCLDEEYLDLLEKSIRGKL